MPVAQGQNPLTTMVDLPNNRGFTRLTFCVKGNVSQSPYIHEDAKENEKKSGEKCALLQNCLLDGQLTSPLDEDVDARS